MCKYCGLIKAIDAYIQKADDDIKEQLEKEGYIDADKTVSAASELEDNIADALKAETALFMDAFSDAVDLETFYRDTWPEIKGADDVDIKLKKAFVDEFEKTMPEFISSYIKDADSEMTLTAVSKRTTNWIKSWSGDLGKIMKLNSADDFERILLEGLDEGYSIDKVARKILDSGIRDEYYKARRAALTEMLRAHSVSKQEAIMQSPVIETKTWVHSGTYKIKPRQNHMDISGQTVPKDKPFTLTGADGNTYYPMYPRDTNLPVGEVANCHCIHQGNVSDDILGLSLEERKKLQQQAIEEDDGAWEKELDAKNKAKAGIDEDTIKMDWLKAKDKNGQIKYLGSKNRWALVESGVIKDDADLAKMYKTTTTSKGASVITRKTLKELKNDGIITVSKATVNHSVVGEFVAPSKLYPNGRLKNGGHSYEGKAELDKKGISYNVTKTFSNGVTLGNIPSHKSVFKRSGEGQAWFPDDWDSDKILVAGTAVSNSKNPIIDNRQIGEYDGVAVRILYNPDTGNIDTVCPDYDQQSVKGVKEK